MYIETSLNGGLVFFCKINATSILNLGIFKLPFHLLYIRRSKPPTGQTGKLKLIWDNSDQQQPSGTGEEVKQKLNNINTDGQNTNTDTKNDRKAGGFRFSFTRRLNQYLKSSLIKIIKLEKSADVFLI